MSHLHPQQLTSQLIFVCLAQPTELAASVHLCFVRGMTRIFLCFLTTTSLLYLLWAKVTTDAVCGNGTSFFSSIGYVSCFDALLSSSEGGYGSSTFESLTDISADSLTLYLTLSDFILLTDSAFNSGSLLSSISIYDFSDLTSSIGLFFAALSKSKAVLITTGKESEDSSTLRMWPSISG